MKKNLQKMGFTLVEVMVATTVGSFIALVAIGTLRTITAGAQMIEANINNASEVRFAAKTLRNDLLNIYRPASQEDRKFIALADESGPTPSSYIVFYTVNRAKARALETEGEIYEVEYYLLVEDDKSTLMRRLWPNPNENVEPGGILSVIAEDIEVFQAKFFDGTEWAYEWPEEMEELPMLVELSIVARETSSRSPATGTLYINLARSMGTMLDEEEETAEDESE
ncbi:MAG: prepilin-type N-terminal cleavage/methylation domain-containing protein [Sedimentisphaerales bacterium]|nr:prepilin-type N-terminal cleavage/methylation domain-containing protein [Sedimentisphaerales bacterium]